MVAAPRHGDESRPIGRDAELATLARLVDGHRLVTVTGLGGVGKTRLATALAQEWVDGGRSATVVDLAPIANSDAVVETIATALRVGEAADTDLPAAIGASLDDATTLLVLDNMEHLLAARLLLAGLLERSTGARVLATSRVPLGLHGERLFRLGGLALPTSGVDVAAAPAGILFLERAAQRGAITTPEPDDASAIVEICRLLDGLPLAIELAAAWTRVLTPRATLRRLRDERLDLSGGRSPRQASIDRIVASTLDLLEPSGREIFPLLGIFAGPFDEAAASAITGHAHILAGLRNLEDAALVRVASDSDGEPRFDLLETIRTVARARLRASGRYEELRVLHVAYFADRAVVAADAVRSSSFGDHAAGRRLAEPDVVTAFERAMESGDAESAVRLAAALAGRGIQTGILREPVARLRRALALSGVSDGVRSDGLNALISLQGELRELDDQVRDAREAVARARAARSPERIVRTLVTLGNWSQTDALDAYGEAVDLAIAVNYTWGASAAWVNLANELWDQRRPEEALVASQRAAAAERAMGNPTGIAETLTQQGGYELNLGRTAAAIEHLAEGAALFAANPGLPAFMTVNLCLLATARALGGDLAAAERTLVEGAQEVARAESAADVEHWIEAAAIILAGPHPIVAARCLGVVDAVAARSGLARSNAMLLTAAIGRISGQIGQRRLDAERRVGSAETPRVVFDHVVRLFRRDVGVERGLIDAPFGRLTVREQEVLALLGEGETDRFIAERLGISPKTASVHVANVKAKLGVETRVAAGLAARDALGFGDGEAPAGEWPAGRRP